MATAATLALDAEMTIVNAAAQRGQLLAAVQAAQQAGAAAVAGLLLDLAAVDAIDSAGLQLLLATRRSLRRTRQTLALAGVRPEVAEAMDVYGLTGELLATSGEPA